jgi:cold shock protein
MDDPGSERQSGTVKWFDTVRGYGFLARDGAVDVFVHASAVEGGGELRAGERVSFEVAEGARGLTARAVRRAG